MECLAGCEKCVCVCVCVIRSRRCRNVGMRKTTSSREESLHWFLLRRENVMISVHPPIHLTNCPSSTFFCACRIAFQSQQTRHHSSAPQTGLDVSPGAPRSVWSVCLRRGHSRQFGLDGLDGHRPAVDSAFARGLFRSLETARVAPQRRAPRAGHAAHLQGRDATRRLGAGTGVDGNPPLDRQSPSLLSTFGERVGPRQGLSYGPGAIHL